jgi:hypothetical protein
VQLAGHDGKVLAVHWPTNELVASGGEDGKLKLHRWNTSTDE